MESLQKNNFFVLAGTSGTGKTSVLQHLQSLGYNCSEEAARAVLTEQLASDGPALPNKKIFLFTPWKEIFVSDNERRMTFAQSVEFHQLLVQTYQSFGYTLIEVPQLPVQSRVEFVLENARTVDSRKTIGGYLVD